LVRLFATGGAVGMARRRMPHGSRARARLAVCSSLRDSLFKLRRFPTAYAVSWTHPAARCGAGVMGACRPGGARGE